MVTEGPADLSPLCARCRHRHDPGVWCWKGRRATAARRLMFAVHGDTCHRCGRPGADTVDHLVPLSRGGTHHVDNLRPAHRYCNIAAGNGTRPTPAVRLEVNERW